MALPILGQIAASFIGDKLLSKKAPEAPTAQDYSKNFQDVLGSVQTTPKLSTQFDYGTIPGWQRDQSTLQAANAGPLNQFNTPEMSAQALQQSFDAYSNMAKTGFGSQEMQNLSNEQFDLAGQRSQQSFKDQLKSLDDYLSGRGMGQSGVAAGQARELAQRTTLDLSTLANQIAQQNAAQQRAYQLQGIQGVQGVGGQAYEQGINTFNTNQNAQQQNFNQQLQSVNQASQLFGQNQNLAQQTYGNALNTQQLNNNQNQILDTMNMQSDQLRFGTASNIMGGASSQQNTAFANQLNNVNSYNEGMGSLIGNAFGNNQNRDIMNNLNNVTTQQQNFLNQLQNMSQMQLPPQFQLAST